MKTGAHQPSDYVWIPFEVSIPNEAGDEVETVVVINAPTTADEAGDLCMTEEAIRAIDGVKMMFLNRFRTI